MVTKNKNESDLVDITDEIKIRMRAPSVKMLSNIDSGKGEIDVAFNTIRDCITEIYSNEDLFSVQDHTVKEVDDFIDSQYGYKLLPDMYYTCTNKEKEVLEKQCWQSVIAMVDDIGLPKMTVKKCEKMLKGT